MPFKSIYNASKHNKTVTTKLQKSNKSLSPIGGNDGHKTKAVKY